MGAISYTRDMARGISLAPLGSTNLVKGDVMGNIFYIIGVIVVVLFILGYLGLR